MKEYTIHEAMETYGISRKQVRYYEKISLIQPCRKGHLVMLSQMDMERIADIIALQNIGLSLPDIRIWFDPHKRQNEKVELLTHAKTQLEEKIQTQKHHIMVIERLLDNTVDMKPENFMTLQNLVSLNDDNMVIDTMVMPYRRNGMYVIREIICTRREYHILRILMRIFMALLVIILVIVIAGRLKGNI